MKLIDNCLYLEFDDLIHCGFGTPAYIRKELSRRAKWCTKIDDPADNRKVLIEYESLSEKRKEKVIDRYGNPYEQVAKAPIRKMVVKDISAEKYFLAYRYDDNKSLPIKNVEAYTTAASWLNMLVKAEDDKKEIKRILGLPVTTFFVKVCEIITSENISLPANIIKLRQRIDRYKKDGYQSLIHGSFGNAYAKKVDCEVSEAVLLTFISMPNADDPSTARRYNTWAVENGKEQITAATVGNWKRKNMALIAGDKFGTRPSYNTFGKHILRSRPSAPLLLVEHDDNELDLYFQSTTDKKDKAKIYYFNRFVIAIVVDAYNDYPLGWGYADTYSKDLIKFAYLDAMYHIKDLTGAFHLPHQIRSDRFGLDATLTNDLAKFYQALSTYTPAAVKVARGKYIEQSFGTKWHQALSCYANYAGNNITAKKKLNQDFREANQRNYPTVDQAPDQISHFINTMRLLVDESTGLSRQEQWLKGFAESQKSKLHLIDDTQLLLKLGTPHTHQNKITNRGITPAINCIERTYEIPEELYLQTVGKTVQVIYDQMDYSRILVTDFQGLSFIAREQEIMPSAIADFKPGDRAKINDRLNEKVRHMQTIADKKKGREDILALNRIDAESYLMAGVHTKEINHATMLNWTAPQVDYPTRPTKALKKSATTLDDVIDNQF